MNTCCIRCNQLLRDEHEWYLLARLNIREYAKGESLANKYLCFRCADAVLEFIREYLQVSTYSTLYDRGGPP